MRSFLTMLGIIIGVASVIILVSLVNAYMSYMTESFASLGTNQITVFWASKQFVCHIIANDAYFLPGNNIRILDVSP